MPAFSLLVVAVLLIAVRALSVGFERRKAASHECSTWSICNCSPGIDNPDPAVSPSTCCEVERRFWGNPCSLVLCRRDAKFQSTNCLPLLHSSTPPRCAASRHLRIHASIHDPRAHFLFRDIPISWRKVGLQDLDAPESCTCTLQYIPPAPCCRCDIAITR